MTRNRNRTRRRFTNNWLCPRCLGAITDEYTITTADGAIHETCESLPRPSKNQREHWTLSVRAAAALAKNKRSLA